MEKAELKSFSNPDEVKTFPRDKLELVKIGGATIGRATFEPGWRWVIQFNHSLRQRVMKLLTSSITFLEHSW